MNAFNIQTFPQSLNKKSLKPEIELEESLTATAWIKQATQKHNFSSTRRTPQSMAGRDFLNSANAHLLQCYGQLVQYVDVIHIIDMKAQHANANRLQ